MVSPAPKNEAYGDFGLRRARGLTPRDFALAMAFTLTVLAVGSALTTQWLARRLAFQPALGEPLILMRGAPLYAPYKSWTWSRALETQPAAQALVRIAELGQYGTLILAWLGGVGLVARARRRANNRADELHGSARWAERSDLERAGLLGKEGVIVGSWEDPQARLTRYLRHDGPEHILTFAPTGSGKGVGLVLPTLLSWKHSVIVLDPKGENFALTSGYRASLGHKVYKLDFAAATYDTAAFNPLDGVRVGTPQEVADADRIARMVIDPNGKQSEGDHAYWANTGAALIRGAILHVLYREKAHGRTGSLADVLAELTDVRRSHGEVLRDWTTFRHDPCITQGWLQEGVPTTTHPSVASAARTQLNRDARDRSPILSSAVAPLELFQDPLLAANTAHSDFSIDDLMDAAVPVSVYLVLRPSDIQRLRPLMRILFDLCLRRLVETMRFADGQSVASHKHRLLLLLDEFPVLGKLDVFAESLAYIRGWGIKADLIAQDYEQLRAAYGDRETISSNCHIKNAYAPTKPETAKLLSTMLGNTTVIRQSRQRSLSVGAFASQRSSESEQEIGRALLTPDECMRLPGARKDGAKIVEAGDMLLFAAGHPPIYGKQPLYFEDPLLLARAKLPPAPPRPEDDARAPTASQMRKASSGSSVPTRQPDPPTPEQAPEQPAAPEHDADPAPSARTAHRASEDSTPASDTANTDAAPALATAATDPEAHAASARTQVQAVESTANAPTRSLAPTSLPPPAPSLMRRPPGALRAVPPRMSATSSTAAKLTKLKSDPHFAALMNAQEQDDSDFEGSEDC